MNVLQIPNKNKGMEPMIEHREESQQQRIIVVADEAKAGLIYSIYDTPPWYISSILGFQHFLTAFGGMLSIPFILLPAMCSSSSIALSEVINTNFFVSGLITVLQASVGVRLPIIQGGTFALIVPTFAILSLPRWNCPTENVTKGTANETMFTNATSMEDFLDIWKPRMCEVQGAIIMASLFQVFIGATGSIGLLLRFISPLVIAPTVALIGIALFESAAKICAENWCIALMTVTLILLFSLYLRNINIPCCKFKRNEGCKCLGYPLFTLFPILLAILVSWLVCYVLTVAAIIPDDTNHWAYKARTDTKSDVLLNAKWIRIPYPGQWGMPTFSAVGALGMLSGIIASVIESVGDYYACARLSGAPPPPVHAINRGVLVEGIGGVLNGVWGTGTGTTSLSQNVAVIGLTKVGSTHITIFGGIAMMIFGTLGKFGALFVTIPPPVIGGVFMVMFGMIAAVGISNLQFVDMNSSRNLTIFGFSFFFGLSLPHWIVSNQEAINTGYEGFDQVIVVLLSSSMFVGCSLALVLDNTVPGSDKERGIRRWRKMGDVKTENGLPNHCYNLPFGMKFLRRWKWTKFIPICPGFSNFRFCRASCEEPDGESF